MKFFLRLLLINLAIFCCLSANAENCNFKTKLTYIDGTSGCLESLPYANKVPQGHKNKLIAMIESSSHYIVSKSKNADCNALGYSGFFFVGMSNAGNMVADMLTGAKKDSIDSCMKQGCDCEIVIDSGNVLVDKDILLTGRTIKSQSNEISAINLNNPNKLIDTSNEKERLLGEAKIQDEQKIAQVKLKEQERLLAEAKLREEQRVAQAKLKEQEAEAKLQEDQRAVQAKLKEQERLLLEAKLQEEQKMAQAKLKEQEVREKIQNEIKTAKAAILIEKPQSITPQNRKALVIGNDTYKMVAKLFNAREDAKSIASNLSAVGYQVTLMLDLDEKGMKSAIRAFAAKVNGGDEVMFFFAGHGVQLGAVNYLLPVDIGGESEAQVRDEAIQLQRILDDMSDRKAKFTLAMIDACRDNPFKSSGRAIGGRGLAPTSAATGQMVVFSAGTGQQALDRLGDNDKNKNGVFTRIFIKEMQKSGVSIDRIIKNVRNEVAELAKSVGSEQVPAIYDQVLGDFYFKR